MTQLKPYPEYKDSGVEWLRQVPERWEFHRVKTVLKERVEKGFPDKFLLAATQTKGVVRKEQYENRTVLAMKDLHLLKLVKIDDFVISLRSFQGGIEYAHEEGIISPAYTILFSLDKRMQKFLGWLFKSQPFIENLLLYVTGIRQGQNIDYEKLSRSILPVPSIEEQDAIVKFLSYTDNQIRKYIRAKQKLIKLLNEQKQAIINRTVTRGLNPYVRLKPSGVDWLGDIPEGWEVKRLKYSIKGCINGIWGNEPSGRDDLICVRVADFDRQHLKVKLEKPTLRDIAEKERPQRILEKYDLLLEKSGGGEQQPVGVVIIYDHNVPAVCSNFIARMSVSMGYNPTYLLYLHSLLYAMQLNVRSIKQTTGIQNLDSFSYLNESVAFPPLPEQKQIADYLDLETAKIDGAVDKTQKQIDLMKEYRTRLISDVVTGKVDVRDIKVPEVEDMEELEPMEEIVNGQEDIEENEEEINADE